LFCVVDRGLDLETVAYDSWIAEKTLDVLVGVTGNFRGLKGMERFPVVFAFVQNCLPTESSLGTFQYEKFEQGPVIVYRDSPFLVVVLNHERTVAHSRPLTPPHVSSQFLLFRFGHAYRPFQSS